MRCVLILMMATMFVGSAQASTPTGARHGAWHVVSITSLSGVRGDDASAVLVQENEAGHIELDWQQGGNVVFSFRIQNCTGDDRDLSHNHMMAPAEFVRTPLPALTRRLEGDLSAWFAEARRTCRTPGRLNVFQLQLFAEALADFSGRVRSLASLG